MTQQPLTPRDFRLEQDSWGQLVLIYPDGKREVGVVPFRAFPVSDSHRWVSVCDAEGHEIFSIEDLAAVPGDMRGILEDALTQREFVPIILRVHSANHDQPSQWRVETDRGPTSFQVNSVDDVRRLEPAHASVVDSNGIRYWIPDLRRLDKRSRRLLEYFL
ncbi:MAG: DUF1854 domain-containing protein [Thermoguttaceae bacterium]|jgi:hypothetical protein